MQLHILFSFTLSVRIYLAARNWCSFTFLFRSLFQCGSTWPREALIARSPACLRLSSGGACGRVVELSSPPKVRGGVNWSLYCSEEKAGAFKTHLGFGRGEKTETLREYMRQRSSRSRNEVPRIHPPCPVLVHTPAFLCVGMFLSLHLAFSLNMAQRLLVWVLGLLCMIEVVVRYCVTDRR